MPIGDLDSAVSDVLGNLPLKSKMANKNPQLTYTEDKTAPYSSILDSAVQEAYKSPEATQQPDYLTQRKQAGQFVGGLVNTVVNAPASMANTAQYWAARALGWDDKKAQDYANKLSSHLQVDTGGAMNAIDSANAKFTHAKAYAYARIHGMDEKQATDYADTHAPSFTEDNRQSEAFQLPQKTTEKVMQPVVQGVSNVTGMSPNAASQAVNAATMIGAPLVPKALSSIADIGKGVIPKVSIEPVNAPKTTLTSGGAAATPVDTLLQGNIDSALSNASPTLQAHANSVEPAKINLPALETRALEEKHGIDLTEGQRTGDTSLYSQEWNKRGETQKLGQHFQNQPSQFSNAFEQAKEKHAPDIPSTADASELGQHEINGLAASDAKRQAAISQAYQALKDANGGQFPIDVSALQNNIQNSLSANLKTNHLSSAIQSDLNDFYKNPTFESFEALRTNLANEMRSSSNGNARGAAYIVRNELENMPVFGEQNAEFNPQAAQLKALADNARQLFKERQDVLRSNPAYKAAVKEAGTLEDAAAEGESLNAAKFHNKYVANATPEAIRRMKAEISPDDIAHQAITFAELERAKNAALNATGTDLKPSTFANFLQKNKSNLHESLNPEAMQDLMEIGALASKVGMPKTGTFNFSNTYSSMLADMAKQGLTTAAEAKLAAMTGGASFPLTQAGRSWWQNIGKEKFAERATNPLSGIVKGE